MLNSLKYAFAAVATALTGGYVVSQNQPAEQPVDKSFPMLLASYESKDLNKKVTLNINGSFGDVVKWMKDQGINFVIADETASKRRIALNFQNKPLKDVLNAIATAMGGTWDKEGDTLVFQSGHFFPMEGKPFDWKSVPGVEGFKWDGKEMKSLPGMPGMPAMPNMKDFKWDGEGYKFFMDGKEMDLKQLEKDGKLKFFKDGDFKMPAMPDMKEFKFDGDAFKLFGDGKDGAFKIFGGDGKAPKVRVWVNGKEVKPEELKNKKIDGKDIKVEVDGNDAFFMHQGQMSDQMKKHIEQSMAEAKKHLEMYKTHQGDRKLTEKERKEVEAAMKEAQAAMKSAQKEMAEAMKGFDKAKIEKEVAEAMKAHSKATSAVERAKLDKHIADAMKSFDHEKLQKEIADAMKHAKEHKGMSDKERADFDKEMKRAHEEMAKAHKEMEKAHKLHGENMKKLLDSITPAQWDLQKKQGYLNLSDLTANQRKLIDVSADDSLTLSYSIDGKKLVIKGK